VYMKRKALFATAAAALLSVASANALAQDAPTPPAPAVVAAPVATAAPAPPAGIAAPAIATAPTIAAAPVVAEAPPNAELILVPGPLASASAVAPAPPALAAQSGQVVAPPVAAEPADVPESQIGFANSLFDEGNYLGVSVEELTRENAKTYGLTGEPRGVGVTQVLKGSPAERAGLREHDIIVRFDGEAVTSVRKLTRLITESSPDHTARITVLRGGSEQELSVTLARRERFTPAVAGQLFGGVDLAEAQRFGEEWAKNAEEWKRQSKSLEGLEGGGAFVVGPSRRIGVATSPLGKQLAEYFGVSHGILVNSVETGSPADKAGVKAGDVVTEIDGRAVDNASDLLRAIGAKEEGDITLTVVREKKQRTIRVTPERWKAPRGLFSVPGATLIAPPVASVALPRFSVTPRVMAAPGAPYTLKDPDFITPPSFIIAPHTFTTPRVFATPRVTVTPRVAPRMTIIKPGRVL